jgi:hypothetical protein
MSANKIVDVHVGGLSPLAQFFKFLAEKLQVNLQIEHVEEFSQDLFQTATALNIDTRLSPTILSQMALLPSQVRNAGALDSFFKDDGKWIPRLLLFEAVRQVLVEKAKDMDIRSPAFVIGDDPTAMTMLAVLIHLGFSELYVVSEDEEQLRDVTSAVAKNYIGVKINPLPATELTMQALSASVVINTQDLSDKTSLLNDLSYFNFMKTSGLILDLQWVKGVSPLLDEAEKADLRIIPTSRLVGLLTNLWLERLQITPSIKVEEIESHWTEFLKQFEG